MSMSDPISDLLTRIRNAIVAGHPGVDIPWSRVKEEVCTVLKREGYILDYSVLGTEATERSRAQLRVALKYTPDRKPVIQGLSRVSKPSLRVYVKRKELRPVGSGLGIAVVSTSKGIMTGKQARAAGVGGEILCEVW